MSTRIDIRFNDARRRLNLILAEGDGILPDCWVVWGRLLHGPDDPTRHEFPSWSDKAEWYVEQLELFLADARAYIDRELAPYRNSNPRKVA